MDKSFKAFVNTCTWDAVLQNGTWEIKNDILTFDVVETKHYQENSIRTGRILSDKNSGKIVYKIQKISDNMFVLESIDDTKEIKFSTTNISFPTGLSFFD